MKNKTQGAERSEATGGAVHATHTPGPWEVRQSSNPKNGTSWRDIVSLSGQFSPSYVGEALEKDAHLIAAAPELLEAVRQAKELIKDGFTSRLANTKYQGFFNTLEMLIAKAEGREAGNVSEGRE